MDSDLSKLSNTNNEFKIALNGLDTAINTANLGWTEELAEERFRAAKEKEFERSCAEINDLEQ